jgi:hypothetical protein
MSPIDFLKPNASGQSRSLEMEWLTDPTVWVGLLTLFVLEIILGILYQTSVSHREGKG